VKRLEVRGKKVKKYKRNKYEKRTFGNGCNGADGAMWLW
jgi:hypothetical protein